MSENKGAIVGLDFGMTNSLLTYFDAGSAGPTPFRAEGTGEKGAQEFNIPTVVAENQGGGWLIGFFARNASDFIQHFKAPLSRLGQHDSERARNKNFQAAKTFLDNLLRQFRAANGGELAKIVVTVPETWISGTEQGGIDSLRQIMREIAPRTELRFVSESVAAACYFSHLHSSSHQAPFNGHVLVFDHGGSTLDISLVRVYGEHIGVVSRYGGGRDVSEQGFGGVLFDQKVFEHIAARDKKLAKKKGREKRHWLNVFEKQKRRCNDEIIEACTAHDFAQRKGQLLFGVLETEILLGDLIDVFEQIFAERIRTQVTAVIKEARSLEYMNIQSAEQFRVVTVGGFSEFYPLRQLLADTINTACEGESVYDNLLVDHDKWLAVSKGACLVAADQIILRETVPYTFGVVTYGESGEENHTPLMEKGRNISDYQSAVFADKTFDIYREHEGGDALQDSTHQSITFYIEIAGKKRPLQATKKFDDTLPDHKNAKYWLLGGMLEKGELVIRIKSDTDKSKSIKMGRFMAMIDRKKLDEEIVDQVG